MGNHAAGGMIVSLAETMAERRLDGETALTILDVAVERAKATSGFSTDAEFDDAPYEDGPFRSLLIEAFGADYDPAADEDGDGFYDDVWRPFAERYGLS